MRCLVCSAGGKTDTDTEKTKSKTSSKETRVAAGTRVFQFNGEAPLFTGAHIFWTRYGFGAVKFLCSVQLFELNAS